VTYQYLAAVCCEITSGDSVVTYGNELTVAAEGSSDIDLPAGDGLNNGVLAWLEDQGSNLADYYCAGMTESGRSLSKTSSLLLAEDVDELIVAGCWVHYDTVTGNFIVVSSSETAGGPENYKWTFHHVTFSAELRYLGLAADNKLIYLTANEGGAFKLLTSPVNTVALSYASATFGTAALTAIDAGTYDLRPVTQANKDGSVYLRGRDGNNRQVQYSTNSGASFTDKSDTGWATARVAVSLLTNPMDNDDLVAALENDDIYRTRDAGTSWSKTGDGPGAAITVAARQPKKPNQLLIGDSAADNIDYTNNYGSTFADVSDTALDTINCIEPVGAD